jgi:hypothetical protein
MRSLRIGGLGLALMVGCGMVYAEGKPAAWTDTFSFTVTDSATLLLLGVGALSLVIARRYQRHG